MTLRSLPAPHDTDVLIIGSGAAGLTAALELDSTLRVTVLSKGPLSAGATAYAQGGVSAVLDATDSVAMHVKDTLRAGAGLCRPEVVEHVAEQGRAMIQWLETQGVDFTRRAEPEGLHLTQEGGHSRRRVAHVADHTGRTISQTLTAQVERRTNISLHTHKLAVDLITHTAGGIKRCSGAYVLDMHTGAVARYRARCVILATGGACKAYLYTSNPDTSSGDGLAMAWRAGCAVVNMEFVQFHPTCLYDPRARSFLITEAIRGEGGRLLLPETGEEFMHRFDPRGVLAPRDIVARSIDFEMKRLGLDYVHLDISHKDAEDVRAAFPGTYAQCAQYGIDITTEPIPVVPAAHYTCGGIRTDCYGNTDLSGLYAVGESAHTGLHGANRMASNSLLECLVFAHAAAAHINTTLPEVAAAPMRDWDESQVTDSDEDVVVAHNWEELRRFMWDYVGIVRSTKRLERAFRRCQMLRDEIADYYRDFRVSRDLLELRNLVQVSELIVRSALARRESRGLHYTIDYPDTDATAQDTVLTPDGSGAQESSPAPSSMRKTCVR